MVSGFRMLRKGSRERRRLRWRIGALAGRGAGCERLVHVDSVHHAREISGLAPVLVRLPVSPADLSPHAPSPVVSEAELPPHPVFFTRSFPTTGVSGSISQPILVSPTSLLLNSCLVPASRLQFPFLERNRVSHTPPCVREGPVFHCNCPLEALSLSHWFTSSLPCRCSALATPLRLFVLHQVSVCDIYL